MFLKTNFHTHTTRCLHATGSDEEYILEAIKSGYKILGFSDHAPYPDNRFLYRMQFEELDEYYNSIFKLKEKYKNKIEIRIGLEIEYNSEFNSYYEELLKKFDYLVLGQHVTPFEGEFINNFELDNTDDYVKYALSVKEALETGYFAFLAHPDLIFLNKFSLDANGILAREIILDAAVQNNTILEFNANGIRRGLFKYLDGERYPYPDYRFWELVSKRNIKVLISADAHDPSNLSDEALDKAFELSKEWKLNIVSDFL
ncbi:MAG: histidinol-phosphatase [Clostridium sp.]|uniref:histidinol-phosphatase n=1 Tax=Clostridium sp. TaxID=1506 RepID=UPI003EE6047A